MELKYKIVWYGGEVGTFHEATISVTIGAGASTEPRLLQGSRHPVLIMVEIELCEGQLIRRQSREI